jgi:hypothetical protein
MGMRLIATLIVTAIFAGQAHSADMVGELTTNYCAVASTSNLLMTEDDAQLKTEIVRLMDEAVLVAKSEEAINLSKPVFVWASEAKVACGKAYGYLQSNYREEDYINKCECFHERLVEYMQ